MRTCDLLRQADYQTINVLQLDLVEPQEYVIRENVATIVIYDFFRLSWLLVMFRTLPCISHHKTGRDIKRYMCVVVALLFYVHGKHLRSCRDGQLT